MLILVNLQTLCCKDYNNTGQCNVLSYSPSNYLFISYYISIADQMKIWYQKKWFCLFADGLSSASILDFNTTITFFIYK